jgi:hypothetical protein
VDRNVGVVVLLVGRISDARHELEGGSEVACSYRPHQSTIGQLPHGQRGKSARDLSAGEQGSVRHGPILAGGVETGQTVLHGTQPIRRTLSITTPSTRRSSQRWSCRLVLGETAAA